jgi:hypothetical protein
MLTLIVLLIFSLNNYCQNFAVDPNTELGLAEDSLGKVFYEDWKTSKIDSFLFKANTQFLESYNLKPRSLKFDYAIVLARLFVKNKEQIWIIKDWYLLAFSSYNFKPDNLKAPLTHVQKAVERYYIMYEFIGIYADAYGKCEEALELLREHKTEFYFDYVKKKGKEKGYDRIWHDLTKKDHTIHTYCIEK